jgi:uncharacterized protein with HEPN domain
MRTEDMVRLRHMIEAAESAAQFIAGRSRSDLDTDRMLLFAVVRAIEVVSEAASKLSEEFRAAHPGIPWRAIVGMRNRLIHAYFDIDTQTVWETTTQELPPILNRLRELAAAG